jgi:hypothetical protein
MTVREYLIKNYDELNQSFDGICINGDYLCVFLLVLNPSILDKKIKETKVTDINLNTYFEIFTE